jgi:iron-sulfur cluster assembly protein
MADRNVEARQETGDMSGTTTTETGAVTVELSELAATEVRKFLERESLSVESAGLRVSVRPGGCSGFEYGLDVEEDPREDDFVLTSHGIRLFVDPFSAQYLSGILIDYHSSFQGSGFSFENPNATGGCGCGSSFSA